MTVPILNGPEEMRERLVAGLRASGALHDDRVAAALGLVPRHVFLPESALERAYADDAVPTKFDAEGHPISSSSQPAIMALMLEQLDVRPGHRVLEIGAGTGYNAACLACLTGPTGDVTTVDIDADLAASARQHLAACGFGQGSAANVSAANVSAANVSVVNGDGGLGWAAGAPYDRIIVTAGAWEITPAWIGQLSADGALVAPLSLPGVLQYSVAFEHAGDHLASTSILACGFMRLRGAFAGPEALIRLGDRTGLLVEAAQLADPEELTGLLSQPGEIVGTGVRVSVKEMHTGLGLWLGIHEPTGIGRVTELPPAPGPAPSRPRSRQLDRILLSGEHGCATLERMDEPDGGTPGDVHMRFEAGARPFGTEGFQLAERLVGHVRDWDAAGQPSPGDLRVSVYPEGGAPPAAAGAIVITKPHSTLVLTWPDGSAVRADQE
ncbi:MAG: methyltransferase, FxLD system [Streptosporangiaceae bacterium]